MRFHAFISYNRLADEALAPKLRTALHELACPWNRMRALRIFLDTTTLPSSHSLASAIKSGLAESAYLLLLASPEAAKSDWVRQEVEWWLQNRALDKIRIVLTGGAIVWDKAAKDFDWSRTTALPEVLRGWYKEEPGYVDLVEVKAKGRLTLDNGEFRRAVLDIAVPLHGKEKDMLDGEDVAKHRKRMRFAWGLILTLLAALAGAGWFWIQEGKQREHAERQKTRAEEQKTLAWKALKRLNNDIPGRLHTRPGSLEILKDVFEANEADLDRYLDIEGENPAAQEEVAKSRLGLGDTWNSLGNLTLAGHSYAKANKLLTGLAQANPGNKEIQLSWAQSNDMLGNIFFKNYHYDESLSAYREGLRIRTELTRRYPNQPELQGQLSFSYVKIGTALAAIKGEKQFMLALEAYRHALSIRQDLVKAGFDNPWKYYLANSYQQIGDLLADGGDPKGSMSAYRRAEEIFKSLYESDPNNINIQKALESSLERIGALLRNEPNRDLALEYFQRRLKISKSLSSNDMDNAEWQLDLLTSHAHVAWVLREQGKLDEAMNGYQESFRIAQDLVRKDPSNLKWRQELAVAYNNIGDVCLSQKKPKEALDAYSQGFEITQDLLGKNQDNRELRFEMAKGHLNFGLAKALSKQFDAAAKEYDEAASIAASLISASPQWADPQMFSAMVENYKRQAEEALKQVKAPHNVRKPGGGVKSVSVPDLLTGTASGLVRDAKLRRTHRGEGLNAPRQ